MKFTVFAILLLAAGSLFARTGVVVGVGFGPGYYGPPPPAPVVAYRPPMPGPGYVWVGGYWVPNGPHYRWTAGYWARPPYAHAYWVAPRYHGGRYYRGFWRR